MRSLKKSIDKKAKFSKVRVEPQTICIAAITPNHYTQDSVFLTK